MSKTKRLLTVVVMLVFTSLSYSSQVFSQNSQTGSGLSISPTRTELRVEPGGSDVVKVNVRNVTAGDITAKAFINDFESDNETGEPRIIVEEDRQSATSIKPFLKNVKDIDLPQGENKTVDINVEVPSNAAPGAYFGVVRYAAVPVGASPTPGQLSLTASVSTIILIEVPGDIRQQIQIREILVYRKGVAGTFFGSKPEEVGVRVLNQGNGFVKPFGTVTVHDPLGNEVHSYELNNANPRSNVLPNSGRVFRESLEGVNAPGRYAVTANVSFGNGGEVLTTKANFWYLPLWFMAIVLLVVILVGLAVYWVMKRVRRGGRPNRKSRR